VKDKRNLTRSMTARYRQAFKHAGDIAALIDSKTPAELTTVDLANLRSDANDLLQCVHEFNAYRNAAEVAPVDKEPRP
jgi:uncharacterized protein YlxP (DUF503 family)